jgi:hypothetical protein
LLVFVAHAGLKEYVPGGLGVTVFFFLSGFLITTLMRSEYDRNSFINFRHFWLRRSLRILPPFYLILGLAALASLVFQPRGTLDPRALLAQVLHFSNYWIIGHTELGMAPGTGVYWSVAVEEHFYLIFPWVYSWMRRGHASPRNQALIFWGLCVAVLLWAAHRQEAKSKRARALDELETRIERRRIVDEAHRRVVMTHVAQSMTLRQALHLEGARADDHHRILGGDDALEQGFRDIAARTRLQAHAPHQEQEAREKPTVEQDERGIGIQAAKCRLIAVTDDVIDVGRHGEREPFHAEPLGARDELAQIVIVYRELYYHAGLLMLEERRQEFDTQAGGIERIIGERRGASLIPRIGPDRQPVE